jgi:hypothetical protein
MNFRTPVNRALEGDIEDPSAGPSKAHLQGFWTEARSSFGFANLLGRVPGSLEVAFCSVHLGTRMPATVEKICARVNIAPCCSCPSPLTFTLKVWVMWRGGRGAKSTKSRADVDLFVDQTVRGFAR